MRCDVLLSRSMRGTMGCYSKGDLTELGLSISTRLPGQIDCGSLSAGVYHAVSKRARISATSVSPMV